LLALLDQLLAGQDVVALDHVFHFPKLGFAEAHLLLAQAEIAVEVFHFAAMGGPGLSLRSPGKLCKTGASLRSAPATHRI